MTRIENGLGWALVLALTVVLGGVAVAVPDLPGDLDLPVTPPAPEGPSGLRLRRIVQDPLRAGPVLPPPPVVPPPTPLADPEPMPFPPPILYGEEIGGPAVVFVLDRSASMWDEGETTYQPAPLEPGGPLPPVTTGRRIDRAKAELTRAIRALPPPWRFAVVEFTANGATALWPALQPADATHKAEAVAWVRALSYGGNTPTFAGVKRALDYRDCDHVVLLTDGEPFWSSPINGYWADPWRPGYVPDLHGTGQPEAVTTCAAADEWLIHRYNHQVRATPARIDVFGLDANTDLMRWFCTTVAAHNGGTFYPVR